MNEVSKLSQNSFPIDWKEIGITAAVTLVTATIAVVVAQKLIIPMLDKAKEKKAAAKSAAK